MSSDITALNSAAKQSNFAADTINVMKPRGIEPQVDVKSESNADDGKSSGQGKDIKEVVAQVENYVQNIRRNLSFSVDEEMGTTVIKVVDANTNELIRQIPSEEFLDIARALEKTKSLLAKTEA